jgi:predicted glycosyltransferase
VSEEEREYLNEMIRSLNNQLVDALRERDEARRMYCEEVEHHHETVWNDGERDFKPLPALDVAISKGWDCFKQENNK